MYPPANANIIIGSIEENAEGHWIQGAIDYGNALSSEETQVLDSSMAPYLTLSSQYGYED